MVLYESHRSYTNVFPLFYKKKAYYLENKGLLSYLNHWFCHALNKKKKTGMGIKGNLFLTKDRFS